MKGPLCRLGTIDFFLATVQRRLCCRGQTTNVLGIDSEDGNGNIHVLYLPPSSPPCRDANLPHFSFSFVDAKNLRIRPHSPQVDLSHSLLEFVFVLCGFKVAQKTNLRPRMLLPRQTTAKEFCSPFVTENGTWTGWTRKLLYRSIPHTQAHPQVSNRWKAQSHRTSEYVLFVGF